ncbi:sensor histidine kinase [Agrilutibacter solisilvae]|nr:histidine kinase [Lysobacter solisilvae]
MTRTDLRFALLNLLPSLAYGGLILLSFSVMGPLPATVWCLAAGLAACFWIVTCALRTRALRRGWFALAAAPLLLRLAGAIALGSFLVQGGARLGLVLCGLAGIIPMPGDPYGLHAMAMYSAQVAIILGLWTASWAGWHLLRHRRQSEMARLRAEAQRNALELDALRARLNPHFVFNALNNARALINEDTERARELITRLSGILRHALEHSQRETVPLGEELAVVDDYLAVEAVHYEERLRVERDVDDAALDAQVPPMMLQLLVENAIKHGIALTPGGGTLTLSARRDDHRLVVEVGNPGHLGQHDTGHGVGLAYLRTRLARGEAPGRFALIQEGARVRARLEIPQGGVR